MNQRTSQVKKVTIVNFSRLWLILKLKQMSGVKGRKFAVNNSLGRSSNYFQPFDSFRFVPATVVFGSSLSVFKPVSSQS